MSEIDRRSFFNAGTGLGVGAVMAAGLAATPALAQATAPATVGPKFLPYEIKPLMVDPAKVRGLSEQIIMSHYENNYVGAIKKLNGIADQLTTMDYDKTPGFVLNGLKREELVATNSMILHELFFSGLGEERVPGTALAEAIGRDFGSPERWRSQFTATGRAQGGGPGWVLLTWSPRDKRLVNAWAADHTTTLAGGTPILAMDLYEHVYQMDSGAKAASDVDVFMKSVRWQNADRLHGQLSQA